jgi:hypothetical protein
MAFSNSMLFVGFVRYTQGVLCMSDWVAAMLGRYVTDQIPKCAAFHICVECNH